MTRYRVTQSTGGSRDLDIYSKTYRFRWHARLIAWIFEGTSAYGDGLTFRTRIEEVE